MIEVPGAVVDAHVHLWRRLRTPQDWIDPVSMHAIDRDFWLDDLDAVLARNDVAGAVIVQASNSHVETQDLLTADLPDRVQAIVGWLDLDEPDVDVAVAGLRALPNGGLLSGIRHLAHIDPDQHWLRKRSVARGLVSLAQAGLSFDLVVTPDQLADCLVVASEHPDLTLVLDHLAKPTIRSGDLSGWESALRALAAYPIVYAKVSGLTMEADWDSWTVDDLKRPVETAFDTFGPERLMFGSDWPLVEVCGGYGAWLDAARALTAALTDRESSAFFSETARAVYRIGGRIDA